MGNRTKLAIRLAAPLALGVAVAIVAAVSSDRIPALDYVLALSWAPAFVLSLLLIGAAAAIGTLQVLEDHDGDLGAFGRAERRIHRRLLRECDAG